MSKFCAFCGKEIPEEATVCPECNAEIVEPEQTEPEQEVVQEEVVEQETVEEVVQETTEEKKSVTITIPSKDDVTKICNKWFSVIKENKVYSAIAIGVLALIVVVILCCTIFGGGYKTAVKDLMSVTFDGKVSNIEDLAPEEFWDEEDIDVDDVVEGYEEFHEEWIEDLEDEYGDNVKISYDFKDSKQMDEDDLKDLADTIHDNYDYIDDDDVTDAYEVELETTIDGDDDDDDDDMELLVVKIDGDWYAMSGNSFYAHYIALSADAIDFDDLY